MIQLNGPGFNLWRPRRLLALCCCLALASALAAQGSLRERAFALYDAGNYGDARPLLEQLDADGTADGVTLYRLYYCQRLAGQAVSSETLERARSALEQAASTSPDLEVPFYLANVYSNLARAEDARRVAAAATARVESGELARPATPVEMFRLGKLYADQGREFEAVDWYGKALDGFYADESATHPPYVRWAAGYLAERAYSEERFEEAEKQYTRLVDDDATEAQLDKLAVSRVRIGEYAEATAAWKRAARLNPGGADRYRYAAALAELAGTIGELPPLAPDGRAWDELLQGDLENVLKEQVEQVRQVRAEAEQAEPIKGPQRRELQKQLNAIKPLFVAAGLEYLLQGYNLREAAFFGGYGPLIFHAREWKIRPPNERWNAKSYPAARAKRRAEVKQKEAQQDKDQPPDQPERKKPGKDGP